MIPNKATVELEDNEFQCAACGSVYEKGWTDEEAVALFKKDNPDIPEVPHDAEFICSSCYNKLQLLHVETAGGIH